MKKVKLEEIESLGGKRDLREQLEDWRWVLTAVLFWLLGLSIWLLVISR